MSLAREDWAHFCNLSGQLLFGDVSGKDDHIVNVEAGEWVAMCERDDSHAIISVMVLSERLASTLDSHGRFWADEHLNVERGDLESSAGVLCMVDRKVGRRLLDFVPPDDKLQERIVAQLGKPTEEGKSERDAFVETCFHLARDAKTEFPQVEAMPFACVFDIGKSASYSVYMTDRRDAVGFQIDRR